MNKKVLCLLLISMAFIGMSTVAASSHVDTAGSSHINPNGTVVIHFPSDDDDAPLNIDPRPLGPLHPSGPHNNNVM